MKKLFVLIISISIAFFANGQCWQMVQANHTNSIGIKTDGSLWSWGRNSEGELGTGNTTSSNVPVKIGTSTWKMVAMGGGHTAAIKTDGTLWTWGYNSDGQLGDGTTTTRSIPMQVGTGTNWDFIAAGTSHCVAIKTDGTLWAWVQRQHFPAGATCAVNQLGNYLCDYKGSLTQRQQLCFGWQEKLGFCASRMSAQPTQ